MTISEQVFANAKSKYGMMAQRLCARFRGILDDDMLTQCADRAIWKCLQKHDDEQQDIKSSLYRFARWECMQAITELHRMRAPTVELVDVGRQDDQALHRMMLEDYLNILNERDRRMVESRFLLEKTFREIAREENVSVQGAIDIVNRSIAAMSKLAKS